MNTRALATQILYTVCFEKKSLSEAFDTIKIPEKDRGFVKEMCFGTLRFWISLQALLKDLLETPLKPKDKDLECLLCVGLYQIIYMHVPDYALVNETVTATRILQKSWASRLVNKILRMAIERKSENTLKTRGITAEFSHPNWIIEKVKAAWPDHWEAILTANNQKAPLFLRINITQITPGDYKKLLVHHKIAFEDVPGLSQGILLKDPMPVENIPGFEEGLFCVQDASGQKIVDYLDLHPHHTVLDACAAPGSKTTHILETVPTLKKLVSVDVDHHRLSKIKENIKRLKLPIKNCQLLSADLNNTNRWWDGEQFDRILLDAPCSATGVIRRHPDIKLLRQKTDIAELASLQLSLLKNIWQTLKVGGKLIYSTCSIFSEENEAVINTFLSTHTDAQSVLITNDWGINLKCGQQVITGNANRDGFYYAIIEKINIHH